MKLANGMIVKMPDVNLYLYDLNSLWFHEYGCHIGKKWVIRGNGWKGKKWVIRGIFDKLFSTES